MSTFFADLNPRQIMYATPSNKVAENSKVSLICSVITLPRLQLFRWYRWGVLVNETKLNILIMESIKREQAGWYMCKGVHDSGKWEARVGLDVLCKY